MWLVPDRRAGGLLRAALGVVVVASLPHAVAAGDAAFSRALSEARCIPAHVALLREEKDLRIFVIRCQGNPPWTIALACRRTLARLSPVTTTEGREVANNEDLQRRACDRARVGERSR